MKLRGFSGKAALLLVLAMCLSVSVFAAEGGTGFTDVRESDYFYPAVQWGAENGITYGVSHDRFAPQGQVTRAQAVTFLWRMAGSPASKGGEAFSDVAADSWYAAAVQWAAENEITNGTGGGKFSPGKLCNRAMCLTMLYRMIGSPLDEAAAAAPMEPSEDITLEELGIYLVQQLIEMFRDPSIFPDVKEGAYYELAVAWGGMNGILTDDNTGKMEEGVLFRPADPCLRGEMISFLYQTKLMQDSANAPELYELGGVTIAIPQAYSALVHRTIHATSDDEDGMLITVSEQASLEAAEAMGEEFQEGAGELFSISRISEAALQELLSEDMFGAEVFAKDEDGRYYVLYFPTDVRYVRETNEQMVEDQEQWTMLNDWARSEVRDDILKYSKGLTPVNFSDTSLEE